MTVADLRMILTRTEADLSALALGPWPLGLYDARTGAGAGPAHRELMDATAGEIDSAVWGMVGTHWFRVTGATAAEVLARFMEVVQDDVIDQLGRGWPELQRDHVFVAALAPTIDDQGRAVWGGVADVQPAIGELQEPLGDHIVW